MVGEAQAIEAVAGLGTAVAGIFSKKQDAKLQKEVTKNTRTAGILDLKNKQIEQERERAKQQARTQVVLFIVSAFLFVAIIAGIIIYKIYFPNNDNGNSNNR